MFVCEDVQKQLVHFVGMLKQEIVILDFEGFRYKNTGIIMNELSLCSNNYSDAILFLSLGKIYAKGKEKTESLQTLFQKEVIDLETPLCPKVDDFKLPIDNITCTLHSFYPPEKQKRKHCCQVI